MATLSAIVNDALMQIGSDPITQGDYDTPVLERARAVSAAWPFVFEHVLRRHSWNSAEVYAQLDADATAPLWGFSTRYALPATLVKLLEVDTTQPWHVVGSYIYTDQTGDDLGIRYTTLPATPDALDATLTDAISLFLACRICKRITNSDALTAQLYARWDDYLKTAKGIDGEEQSDAELEDDTWVADRW